MDIHILHKEEQLGPFTEDAVQALLKEGRLRIDDPAWRDGMKEWIPLVQVLYPAASDNPGEPAAPKVTPAAARSAPPEPATERQKAFLSYMGVPLSGSITRDEAAKLVNDTMEHPKDPARVARWNEERLQLHPSLFAAEIQARKENRAQRYFEISQHEGSALFDKITKAHCQVLVGHLDVRSPNWDANEREATWKYFFPAVAEKFPQLVTEEGRERLKHFAHDPGPAHRSPASPAVARTRAPSSPSSRKLLAVVRGLIIGIGILGALWWGRSLMAKRAPGVNTASLPAITETTPAETATPPPAEPPPETASPAPLPVASAAVTEPPPSTSQPAMAAADPAPAAAGAPSAVAPMAATDAAPLPTDLPTKVDLFAPPPAAGLIPPSPVRNTVILTKPVPVTLAYGKVTVPAGTTVSIVQRNGQTLSVRYLDKVIDVPASSTDLGTDPAPVVPAAPAPQ